MYDILLEINQLYNSINNLPGTYKPDHMVKIGSVTEKAEVIITDNAFEAIL